MKRFFLHYKHPISVLLAVIIVAGLFFYNKMQISLFPEITFPKIKIIANNGDQPVDKMMVTVTRKLENAVKEIPDINIVRSTTSRGSCEISAFLTWKSDIDLNMQILQAKINEIKNDLPANVDIRIEKMNPSTLPVMGYTLESKNKTPIELNLIANTVIKPFLSQVEGISSVRIIGGKTKEYWILLHPQVMSAFGIVPSQVRDVINQSNFITSNGYLSDYRRLYLTLTDTRFNNKSDIENIILKNDGKRIVRIHDIADVQVREKVEYVKTNANGKENLLIAVLKQPDANLIGLSDRLEKRVKELQEILPKDVIIKPYYNQADFVSDAIGSIRDNLWVGLLLAIIVSFIFLRSLRTCVTILFTIPIILLLTISVLYGFGYTLNIMSIGAIAASIGLIIDDTIVVVEQIHRTHEEQPDENISSVVHKSVHYLLPSMIGSSLSTIIIFIPFFLLGGVAGAYFNVLTNTMIITLICSFVVTWLGLPVIYLLLAGKKANRVQAKTVSQKTTKQRKWVAWFMERPVISLIIALILIFSGFIILPKLETGFLPEMDEGSIVLDYVSPPGTSLEETDQILRKVEKIITAIPDVATYSRRTGTQMGFFITEPNTGDYLIQLKKKRKYSTYATISELRDQIEKSQPALRIDFGQVIGDMLGDLMASAQPIEIKIFGNNPEKIENISNQVAAVISKVKGTADVFNGITIAGPYVEVKPDAEKLSQFNISAADFQFQFETQLEGNIIGSIPEREQQTDIRMIYPKSSDAGVNSLRQQMIFLPDGKLKPITDLASIKIKQGVSEIERENLQPVVIVTSRLQNRDLGSVMKDIETEVNKSIFFPQGYHKEYGGEYLEQKKSFASLMLILITASLLVFALMLFLYKDLKAAAIILFIAVLGTAGSLIALWITNTPLNVGSYTGLIMIVGIIGENAIFTYQQFITWHRNHPLDESIVYAISTRLRPNLMTATGAIVALLPLAMGIGTGAKMHQPLAIAVIGGFCAALVLLLIILPSLLKIVYKSSLPHMILHERLTEQTLP